MLTKVLTCQTEPRYWLPSFCSCWKKITHTVVNEANRASLLVAGFLLMLPKVQCSVSWSNSLSSIQPHFSPGRCTPRNWATFDMLPRRSWNACCLVNKLQYDMSKCTYAYKVIENIIASFGPKQENLLIVLYTIGVPYRAPYSMYFIPKRIHS